MKPFYPLRLMMYSIFVPVFLCAVCSQAFSQTRAEKVNAAYLQSKDTLKKILLSAENFWNARSKQDTSFNAIIKDLRQIKQNLPIIWQSGNYDKTDTNSNCKEKLTQDIDNYT